MERPRFTDHLEAIKFICKDFWSELFKKQIDNLKTNHRVSFYFLLCYFFEFLLLNLWFILFIASNEKSGFFWFGLGYICVAR